MNWLGSVVVSRKAGPVAARRNFRERCGCCPLPLTQPRSGCQSIDSLDARPFRRLFALKRRSLWGTVNAHSPSGRATRREGTYAPFGFLRSLHGLRATISGCLIRRKAPAGDYNIRIAHVVIHPYVSCQCYPGIRRISPGIVTTDCVYICSRC